MASFNGYVKIAEGVWRPVRRANTAPAGAVSSAGPQPPAPPGAGAGTSGTGTSGGDPGGGVTPPPEDDADMVPCWACREALGDVTVEELGSTSGVTPWTVPRQPGGQW